MNGGIVKSLDIETVQAFIAVADLKSFTRAAEALETTQSLISLKVKRLETQLGRRLLERTPRMVRLSSDGAVFLEAARRLVEANEKALLAFTAETRRLSLGVSDHIAGADLPLLIKRLSQNDPLLMIELQVATSRDVLDALDHGRLDAAIVLRHDDRRRDGEVLFKESFGWFASADFVYGPGATLRIATLTELCAFRGMMMRTLDQAGIGSTEVFIGGGVASVAAAISAGLAVSVLSRRVAPTNSVDFGIRLALPAIPDLDVVLHTRADDAAARQAVRAVAAAFRAWA